MKKINYFLLFSMVLLLSFSLNSKKAYSINLENNEKVIYITFDDGPGGKVTKEVLDILKKENIHATFFVIGSQVKGQEDIVLRMKDEGHSIGLHSFSHDRNKLYSCSENFLKEMIKCQDILYEVTNEKYTILRFPFGCNNSTYKLKKDLVDSLHNNNYKIFDWTLDSGDGKNYKSSPQTLIKNSCKLQENIVLLMHCSFINENSAKALPSIIKFYKDNGYEFKTIDENTPEIYKLIKK